MNDISLFSKNDYNAITEKIDINKILNKLMEYINKKFKTPVAGEKIIDCASAIDRLVYIDATEEELNAMRQRRINQNKNFYNEVFPSSEESIDYSDDENKFNL